MNQNTEIEKLQIGPTSLKVIDDYRKFKLTPNSQPISVPYFNNSRRGLSTGLRVLIGKGTPKDIKEEIEIRQMQEKLAIFNTNKAPQEKTESPEVFENKAIKSEFLKKYMYEHNIGIDCSGYAYAILEEENKTRGYDHLKNHLSFPYIRNFFLRVIKSKIRAVENTDVRTFAHPENSTTINLKDIHPGDFISMIDVSPREKNQKAHDHIVLIYAVDYIDNKRPENLKNSDNKNAGQKELIPKTLYYTHSIARPEDGEWNHGVRNGIINITDISAPVMAQEWLEEKMDKIIGKEIESSNLQEIYTQKPNWMRQYKVEIKRLKWWK